MPLFQNSVVSKYLKNQNVTLLLQKWEAYKKHFLNLKVQEDIKSLKEEQYQGEFLEDLFVKILGYTKPASSTEIKFNLTTEYKNVKDSKKADGAIIINDKVIAVIELKGTNTTDLGKIETQAFGYKNNQPDCVYVITSNFEKIRFYIDNAIEFLEFNLFQLTQTEFELLYLCLAYDNLSKGIAKTIKDESVSQEDVITKKLYKDYSLFKRELHQNLVALNPQYEPIELFKKSQKLLDRFLFIFFAEDRNLLPTNLIFRINKEWQNLRSMRMEVSLYDRYKTYFKDLNNGAKVQLPAFSQTISNTFEEHQIFAYNGGLFKADDILDNIKIDDALLFKHTENLSNYDFASEVDVNILGHIFENSLNELDEIKAATAATNEHAPLSKRKKDGVFYTPKYITKYIVENTVGKLCEEKKTELQLVDEDYTTDKKRQKKTLQALIDKVETYRSWLLQLTICDPACGSGAFLNQALDFLIAEHQYIDELKAKLFGDTFVLSDVENSILENNLFGVDLNEESVEIAKLSLWLRTAQPNRKLNDLSNNIKCGNSLIDDAAIAGEKAFNWQTAFPRVFKEKDKKVWHLTTAIHDSRTSQRMIDYKVREKRDMGTNPYPQVKYLTEEEENIIVNEVYNIVKEDNLNLLSFNVCKDHMHIVLACEEEYVPKIMQKIKAKSARSVNIYRGVTIPNSTAAATATSTTTEHTPLSIHTEIHTGSENAHSTATTMEHAPLSIETEKNTDVENEIAYNTTTMEHAPLSIDTEKDTEKKRGEKQNSLWTQKYNCKEITSPEQLHNTIEYVKHNRNKHNLPAHSKKTALLIENMLCTQQKAFEPEYNGGFDVIIGNPPYVLCQPSNTNEVTLDYYKKFEVASYKIDLFHLFFEKSITLLKEKGKLGFITPNTFLTNKYIQKLRNYILKNTSIETIVNYEDSVFVDAGVDVATIILNKKENLKTNVYTSNKGNLTFIKSLNQNEWLEDVDNIFNLNNEFTFKFIDCIKVDNICSVTFGLQTKDKSTYVLENKVSEEWENCYTGSDINRFNLKESTLFFKNNPEEVKAGGSWNMDIHHSKKIVVRQVGNPEPIFAFDNFGYATLNTMYSIVIKDDTFSYYYLLAILNSTLIKFYFLSKYSDGKQLFPKVKGFQLKELPIKKSSIENQKPFIEKVELMLSLNKTLQQQQAKVINMLQRDYGLTKPTKKLETWYELPLQSFFTELAKAKIVLSAVQKDEVQEYFETYQKQAVATKNQIIATDKQIDKMVYELYGLSEEEIEIVENS